MATPSSPFDLMRLGFEAARLGVEAQSVIWLRTLGSAGLWNTPFDESYRMVAEKHGAFLKAGGAVLRGTMAGHDPVRLARSALEPLDAEASANRQRLAKRGRRKPVF